MTFDWRTEYRPSPFCLKQKGKRAIVVRFPSYDEPRSNMARLYDGYANGEKVYDVAAHYRVGQVIEME